jgi:uncharacterized glyoxalase superfamily protein PhnB
MPATRATGSTLTPYLAVRDARSAIDWYTSVFRATAVGEPILDPGGRVGHAELVVFGGRLFLSDAHEEIGVVAPVPGAGWNVTIHASVDGADAIYKLAVHQGAAGERPAADTPYGRIAVLVDPFGHRWMLNQDEPAES